MQIHALHNLIEIKSIQISSSCEPADALCLKPYIERYNSLEWKYLSTYSTTLTTVKTSYLAALEKISNQTGDNFITLMSDVLCDLRGSEVPMLLQKIYEECIPRFGSTNTKLVEIQSTHSLLYVIDIWFTKLENILCTIRDEIDGLKYFTENVKSRNHVSSDTWRNIMELVQSVYDCHLSEIRVNIIIYIHTYVCIYYFLHINNIFYT